MTNYKLIITKRHLGKQDRIVRMLSNECAKLATNDNWPAGQIEILRDILVVSERLTRDRKLLFKLFCILKRIFKLRKRKRLS